VFRNIRCRPRKAFLGTLFDVTYPMEAGTLRAAQVLRLGEDPASRQRAWFDAGKTPRR
jgi:hypothetical protein